MNIIKEGLSSLVKGIKGWVFIMKMERLFIGSGHLWLKKFIFMEILMIGMLFNIRLLKTNTVFGKSESRETSNKDLY